MTQHLLAMDGHVSETKGRDLRSIIEDARPDLAPYEDIYKYIHQHPELSGCEQNTALLIARNLNALGFAVHEKIGGSGVVGVLENGHGRGVMLRADMDALPLEERTGLPYASKVHMKDRTGTVRPAMHACGHDLHVTCLLAATKLLLNAKDHWTGTLIVLFQPDEEGGRGAQAMVDDGLYKRIPMPDVIFGQHVMPFKSGTLGTNFGVLGAAADGLEVTLTGRGGHGSRPCKAVNPIFMAAMVVNRLQGLVSYEIPSSETAVVTVGSIHAGTVENIIPERAVLKISMRTRTLESRSKLLDAIDRIVNAECSASGGIASEIKSISRLPLTMNDSEVTNTVLAAFHAYFGDQTVEPPDGQGSEDFSNLARPGGVPYCYWLIGAADSDKYDAAEKAGKLNEWIPGPHSPLFAPVINPTLRTGVDALALMGLTFMA